MLNWKFSQSLNLNTFVVERNTNNSFTEIGRVEVTNRNLSISQYNFLDILPKIKNAYRLKIIKNDGTFTYSNIILLSKIKSVGDVRIYPNPVSNILNLTFTNQIGRNYKITLLTSSNQLVKEIKFASSSNSNLQIYRTVNMPSGLYILKILDINSNEEVTQKVIFR